MDRQEILKGKRQKALEQAVEELTALGFQLSKNNRWSRNTPPTGAYPIEVEIPDDFPSTLPIIYIERAKLERRIPHIEASGKVCIAQEGAVLIDTDAPKEIVKEAIQRAEQTIKDGLAGKHDNDLFTEFLAYWDYRPEGGKAIWLLPIPKEATEVCRAHTSTEGERIIAQTDDEIKYWAQKTNKHIRSFGHSFFLPLKAPIYPPDFGERYTIERILEMLSDSCEETNLNKFLDWLKKETTPCSVIAAFPSTSEDGCVCFGFIIPRTDALYHTQLHLKPKNAADEINLKPEALIGKIEVERHDPHFITTRGGAPDNLQNKTVAIIGCGSLGSQAARLLAYSGIGKLRLIDKEPLSSCNLHRHLLGADSIGLSKVTGIEKELTKSLPALKVEIRASKVQDVLSKERDFVSSSDAILVATGDEALDRVLNELLIGGPPTVFSWIEPLGIGGHALLIRANKGNQGCFECLYEPVDGARIGNVASFVAHGQELGRSFAGCAGRFMPYSALDAIRTATEATRLIVETLIGTTKKNTLLSWFGNSQDLTAAGFRTSDRVRHFALGGALRNTDFKRLGCRICG